MQPLLLLRLLIRSIKVPAYRRRWRERYGYCQKKVLPNGILLHAVSVGEVLAAIPLVRALRQFYPLFSVTITTMTPTGSEQVIAVLGKDVKHVYLPYDLPCAMKRFLNILRPKLVIVMETELWPNMISILHARNIPLIIANARLSEKSAKTYAKLKKSMQRLLSKITLIAAQNKEDGERFISLGLQRNRLAIIGNLKFDLSLTTEMIKKAIVLREKWARQRQIWIATSTHDGEEIIILKTHRKLLKTFPDLMLILVPRHPERFSDVLSMVKKIGFNFVLRSSGETPSKNTQVVIGDTMGELMLLYGVADLAFVGGSLVKKGGHNPLEAAAHSIPILVGPYTYNFKDIYEKLHQAGGLITLVDFHLMIQEITILLTDHDYRFQCGHRAKEVLYKNQGVLSSFLQLVEPYLTQGANNVSNFISDNTF